MITYHVKFILVIIFHALIENSDEIINGVESETNKPFMVYLIRSDASDKKYRGWMCGGSIISTRAIVTAHSCLEDVKIVYVIAGYRKYVSAEHSMKDTCHQKTRRRIILSCHYKDNSIDNDLYKNTKTWSTKDIAVGFVSKPFDFNNTVLWQYCSYAPTSIKVNSKMVHLPNEQALVYGWGHTRYYRPTNDHRDYNQPVLKYTSTVISSFDTCANIFNVTVHEIDNVICAYAPGNINELGEVLQSSTVKYSTNSSVSNSTTTVSPNASLRLGNGFCQNDHGSPLTQYIKGEETLIGIATAFQVSKDMECHGPFFYTSASALDTLLRCAEWKEGLIFSNNAECAHVSLDGFGWLKASNSKDLNETRLAVRKNMTRNLLTVRNVQMPDFKVKSRKSNSHKKPKRRRAVIHKIYTFLRSLGISRNRTDIAKAWKKITNKINSSLKHGYRRKRSNHTRVALSNITKTNVTKEKEPDVVKQNTNGTKTDSSGKKIHENFTTFGISETSTKKSLNSDKNNSAQNATPNINNVTNRNGTQKLNVVKLSLNEVIEKNTTKNGISETSTKKSLASDNIAQNVTLRATDGNNVTNKNGSQQVHVVKLPLQEVLEKNTTKNGTTKANTQQSKASTLLTSVIPTNSIQVTTQQAIIKNNVSSTGKNITHGITKVDNVTVTAFIGKNATHYGIQ